MSVPLPKRALFFLFAVLAACGSRTPGPRPADVFRPSTGLVRATIENRAFAWQHRRTAHLDAHFLPDRWTSCRVDTVLSRMEELYRANAIILGDSAYGRTIEVFLVGPKADVGTIAGSAVTAMALLPELAVVHSNLVLSTRPEILQHELMHVMSFDIWGMPGDFYMTEGLATAAYGTGCYGCDFDAIAGYLLRKNELPTLRQMVDDILRYDEVATHYSAASLVRMVERRYGTAGVRTLWTDGIELGAVRLGTSLNRLDREWRGALTKVVPITDSDWMRLTTADVDSLQTGRTEP